MKNTAFVLMRCEMTSYSLAKGQSHNAANVSAKIDPVKS